MNRIRSNTIANLALVAALLAGSGCALAAAQRTFVASTGADTNPCTLTSPCRSFGTALAATADGGEIIVLDSAGYGAVIITKSVAITAPPGIYAGISVASLSGVGVTVNGAGISVALRGLTVNSTAAGTYTGIYFTAGSKLAIERCTVRGFTLGIFSTAPDSKMDVSDTVVRETGSDAIAVGVNTGADIRATLTRVRVENGGSDGVVGQGGATVGIVASTISGNAGIGVRFDSGVGGRTTRINVADSLIEDNDGGGVILFTNGAGNTALLSVARSTIARSSGEGVRVIGSPQSAAVATIADSLITDHSTGVGAESGAIVHVANNTVTRNGFGYSNGGGSFNSLKTSYVFGNTTDISGTVSGQPGQ